MNGKTTEAPTGATTQSARLLLTHLIDYAGLFPPAALNMRHAVTNYDAYMRSQHSWMLGRFIVPAARLKEFDENLRQLSTQPENPWSLSVLLGPDAKAAEVANINVWDGRSCARDQFTIDSVEAKVNAPEDVGRLSAIIPPGLKAYFEVPLAGRELDNIAAIAECGRAAKIRTGGETADKIPDSKLVLDFMKLCADAKVPFKATAGLHHPIRSVHRLTYQPDSASALMHGFVNVFLAAAFLRKGMVPQLVVELLNEQSANAIRFEAEAIMWREHRIGAREIEAARQGFSISFGSCSFTEPIEDLRSLGLL